MNNDIRTTQKAAARTTATGKKDHVFTAEERAAMRQRAQELKAAANKEAEEDAVLAKIAEMQESDRVPGEGIHAILTANAPTLWPKLWYGMPSYANNAGKIICFFQAAQKFNTRYATFGFNPDANLDDGNIWPVAFALTELTAVEEVRIAALVKQAVS